MYACSMLLVVRLKPILRVHHVILVHRLDKERHCRMRTCMDVCNLTVVKFFISCDTSSIEVVSCDWV